MHGGTYVLHWVIAGTAFFVLVLASAAPAADEAGVELHRAVPRLSSRVYAGWLGLSLCLFRWPTYLHPFPLSVDESQFIAGALTLLHDPVAWRAFDGQTSGPLNYYAIAPLGWVGGLNYCGLRLLGSGLIAATLWLGYRGLRSIWGEGIARLGVLPGWCFFAFTTRPEFVHYASELLSLFLLAIATTGVLGAMACETSFRPWARSWVMAGLALGALPFAKLQGVPQAAVLLVGAVLWAATRRDWSREQRMRAIGVLIGALLVVPLVFATMLSVSNSWENFWISYFAQTLVYAQQAWHGVGAALVVGWRLVTASIPFAVFFFSMLGLFALVVLLRLREGSRPRLGWPLGLLSCFTLASLWVALTGRPALHYLLFLLMPLSLLAAGALGEKWRREPSAAPAKARRGTLWVIGFLGLTVAPAAAVAVRTGNFYLPMVESAPWRRLNPISREILRHTQPDDCLTVWAYWAEPHVETGLRQGTSTSNAWSELVPGPYRDYFRRRYLRDLQRNQPKVFVDAVNPRAYAWFFDRATEGHETWPELRDHIAQHYVFTSELEGARIYVRKPTETR